MGQFLNNKEPYDKYRTVKNASIFVDKSEILEELIPALRKRNSAFSVLPVQGVLGRRLWQI